MGEMKTAILPWGERTFVMGVINVTPDSFSGDGLLAERAGETGDLFLAALSQARRFADEGADIVDIGGESTRPGAQPISEQEELARVVPAVKAVASAGLNIFISVDTSKGAVADAALEAGAHLVNDVCGLRADPTMAEVVARHQAPVILMHNRLKPASAEVQARLGGRYVGAKYTNLLENIKTDLEECITLARAAGIPYSHIILYPGIGFGKTVEQNLELLDRLDELRSLGYPLLVGPSRKSFIGYTLDLPPDQRIEGTAAAVAISIARRVDIVRVHDVGMMVRVVRMSDAIVRRKSVPVVRGD